ncbi:hypothetical protein IZ6_12960 [Terrihabitans soli]|uniref:Uncharacterized protein n=1 Tax=Terrihabitans soli TaxID=708113 RepID=A0A6S6QU15_9HYPH|nr:hypothetical protein [Terrihabitans soli]BCJ90561.1 hypothetical protein IZ6_12960 [Terrihabitans soli]
MLHSPGGNILGSLKLGIAFRDAKSTVSVAPQGGCYSACAYALFGGVNRQVPKGAKFGVHDFTDVRWKPGHKITAAEQRENEQIYDFLRAYAKSMGVSPSLVSSAQKTPHEGMRVLSRKELAQNGVVTGR